jgi:MucR family transcriptional regulator, transcriptional regulator of exopolysaccharide biosynthesis
MPSSKTDRSEPVALTADIVAAYVSYNSIPKGGRAELIRTVHETLLKLGSATAVLEPGALVPAVSVRNSITLAYLICLDDGKKFKSLKRHLASLGMTPDQYRQKWGLPKNYPMVAVEYGARRSALAKSIGLGKLRKDADQPKS